MKHRISQTPTKTATRIHVRRRKEQYNSQTRWNGRGTSVNAPAKSYESGEHCMAEISKTARQACALCAFDRIGGICDAVCTTRPARTREIINCACQNSPWIPPERLVLLCFRDNNPILERGTLLDIYTFFFWIFFFSFGPDRARGGGVRPTAKRTPPLYGRSNPDREGIMIAPAWPTGLTNMAPPSPPSLQIWAISPSMLSTPARGRGSDRLLVGSGLDPGWKPGAAENGNPDGSRDGRRERAARARIIGAVFAFEDVEIRLWV